MSNRVWRIGATADDRHTLSAILDTRPWLDDAKRYPGPYVIILTPNGDYVECGLPPAQSTIDAYNRGDYYHS